MSITIVIIALSVIASLLAFQNQELFEKLKHYPFAEHKNKEYYRMISSGFIHGSYAHLFINMYVLYGFGITVENTFIEIFGVLNGRLLYVALYVLGIIAADIPTFIKHKNNMQYASIGASGAVSAILFSFILFYPLVKIGIIFIPIGIPGIIMGVLYLIYSSWASKKEQGRIDHDAHFYGAIFGVIFTIVFVPQSISAFINQISSAF
jgi:membrane associated rhomboid family serine protease